MKNKINIKKELKKFHVTIFGSARIEEDDFEYKEVYELAKMVGERGMNVVSGGGPGVMKAATMGHKAGREKNKAYTIGLGIKLPHEQRINPYVDVKFKFTRFSERLDNFMLLSNVVVVAPGGVGTMLELFFTWQLMQVRHMSHIPIILLGRQWNGLLRWLRKVPLRRKFFNKEDLELLFLAKDSNEAIKLIDRAYEKYKKGGKNLRILYK